MIHQVIFWFFKYFGAFLTTLCSNAFEKLNGEHSGQNYLIKQDWHGGWKVTFNYQIYAFFIFLVLTQIFWICVQTWGCSLFTLKRYTLVWCNTACWNIFEIESFQDRLARHLHGNDQVIADCRCSKDRFCINENVDNISCTLHERLWASSESININLEAIPIFQYLLRQRSTGFTFHANTAKDGAYALARGLQLVRNIWITNLYNI